MKVFEVYEFADVDKGWGFARTYAVVIASNKEEAIKLVDKPRDPFWIEHDIREVSILKGYELMNPERPKLIMETY